MNNFYLPLMSDNIDRGDINSLIEFLQQDPIPKLTNGPKVVEFENAWGQWLGTKYNLMLNSGAYLTKEGINIKFIYKMKIFIKSFQKK
jgi:dTDP-4-amino-4,6-dideoxygalactose transaminase